MRVCRSGAQSKQRWRLRGAGGVATSCTARAGKSSPWVRVIGDGGWYFHIADMAARPARQRRGPGGVVMEALLGRIRAAAPGEAPVSLMADPPGRPLYSKFGFAEDRQISVGMFLWLR
jgi:GNAT superfamily N-acetyltransferase